MRTFKFLSQSAALLFILLLTAACSAEPTSAPVNTVPSEEGNTMKTASAPATVNAADYVTTTSGLKYYDFAVGDGAAPTAGQEVSVHYTGWLVDGTKFDSSLDRGELFAFAIGRGQVIAGWDEGVMSMKVGGKRQLVIPPALGYGARGAGGVIPPNATLVFEVELVGVR